MDFVPFLLGGAGLLGLLLAWRRLSGGASVLDLDDLKSRGALLLDVRSAAEFQGGHAPGSLNIPLDQLGQRLEELDPGRSTVVCCASGARSATARTLLVKAGFQEVHNAGPWRRLLG